MKLQIHAQQRTQQQLQLTPQLQKAIALLPLSQCELQTEMIQVATDNPLLECTLLSSEDMETAQESEGSDLLSSALPAAQEWPHINAQIGSSAHNTHHHSSSHHSRSEWEDIALSRIVERSLYDRLHEQIAFLSLSVQEREICSALIESLDENGYLSTPLEVLSEQLAYPVALLERALRHIQECEPVGIGARSVQECLSLQLSHPPLSDEAEPLVLKSAQDMVRDHLSLVAKHQYQALSHALHIDMHRAQAAMALIQKCHPRPANQEDERRPDYVIPDAFIFKKASEWQVRINTAFLPQIRIHREYAELLKQCKNPQDRDFLKDHLQEARWFLKSLDSRHQTLQWVVEAIVRHQTAFLEQGLCALKPLILQSIAQELSLHESTISRITTNKYVLTPRGVFELKYFFSASVAQSAHTQACSNKAVQALIKQIIQTEDSAHPWSDQSLSQILLERGMPVARRTVAKYRELLHIPPSHERKRVLIDAMSH